MLKRPFTKLDIDLSFIKNCSKGRFIAGYGGISYSQLDGEVPQSLLDAMQPERVRFVEVSGPIYVGPHKDQVSRVSVNMYHAPGNCFTQYWLPKRTAIEQRARVPTSDSRWSRDEVHKWTGFRALPGDSYLLDVTKIHSVERDRSVVRQFVQFSWINVGYETILERIKQFTRP